MQQIIAEPKFQSVCMQNSHIVLIFKDITKHIMTNNPTARTLFMFYPFTGSNKGHEFVFSVRCIPPEMRVRQLILARIRGTSYITKQSLAESDCSISRDQQQLFMIHAPCSGTGWCIRRQSTTALSKHQADLAESWTSSDLFLISIETLLLS